MAAKATVTNITKGLWSVSVETTDADGRVVARQGSTVVGTEKDARAFARELGGRGTKITKS
jgi:hypothetical protein